MQLILLSGGSGKRLWPLSNDARSKQFLPLLASPNGGMESMIQRVVRQIREAKLTNNITFATNAVQRDSIINQLGEDINIVTEPEQSVEIHSQPSLLPQAILLKNRNAMMTR